MKHIIGINLFDPSFHQRGAGAEPSGGVGFGPPVCLVGHSGPAAGEFTLTPPTLTQSQQGVIEDASK